MVQMSRMLARLKREPFVDLPIADHFEQLLRDNGHGWRERLLPPLVTLRLFVIQILGGNVAIAALRQLSGIDFAPPSYCDARARMPLRILESLLRWMHERARPPEAPPRRTGPRILIADGSTHSMGDTPALRKHFTLAPGTRPGVGYPMAKLMGLLDAVTGMFVSLLSLPLFQHDLRGVIGLHAMLDAGDILLGDRGLCSFVHVALLNGRNVFACFRLHQRRKDVSPGLKRWKKPSIRPAWMTAEQFALLPREVDVRLVRHAVVQQGYRTRQVIIATTLLDRTQWPDEKIAELYGHRWQIETCFNHLKTTMKMNVLRCKTVDGIMKELVVYLTVYNLVRMAMLDAARRQGVDAARISFIDAMRWLLARLLGLPGVGRLIVNPDRTGRTQLRVIRRRIKPYDLLQKPRREKEAEIAAKQGANA